MFGSATYQVYQEKMPNDLLQAVSGHFELTELKIVTKRDASSLNYIISAAQETGDTYKPRCKDKGQKAFLGHT